MPEDVPKTSKTLQQARCIYQSWRFCVSGNIVIVLPCAPELCKRSLANPPPPWSTPRPVCRQFTNESQNCGFRAGRVQIHHTAIARGQHLSTRNTLFLKKRKRRKTDKKARQQQKRPILPGEPDSYKSISLSLSPSGDQRQHATKHNWFFLI